MCYSFCCGPTTGLEAPLTSAEYDTVFFRNVLRKGTAARRFDNVLDLRTVVGKQTYARVYITTILETAIECTGKDEQGIICYFVLCVRTRRSA